MAKCMISNKDCVTFQYVRFTEAPEGDKPRRSVYVRFDQLQRAHEALPDDYREPYTLRWNPGKHSDDLGLEEHRRLADNPKMRGLPDMVRAIVPRARVREKLAQFIKARERLLNP